MALIFFAQTMFGIVFVIRILRKFRERALISTTCLTKIGTVFAFIICFVGFLQLHFLSIIALVVVLRVILQMQEQRRTETFLEHFPIFIDHWLLNLRTGLAPTSARESALQAAEPDFRALVSPLFAAAETKMRRHKHLFLTTQVIFELKSIVSQSHNTIPRLTNLRETLRRESGFRRKSGQAIRQAAVQSTLLVVLHFALCIFVVLRSGLAKNLDLIAISTALTVFGVLILRLLARRIRWTV